METTAQQILVRPARIADAPVIAEFNRRLASETESRSLEEARLRQGVEALLRDASKGLYFVAEAEGQVVGQLMLTYEWSDWRNGTFWWIQSVYVRPECRRRGVLTALFEHVSQLANRERDVCGLRLYVDKHNRPAHAVYERLGLRPSSYEVLELDFVPRSG
jgi:GNAT superfamily N-acetyltransferase